MTGLFGGSSANTDRGNQLAATQGEWSIFNSGLPAGQQGQATGQQTLNTALQTQQPAEQYFSSLLTGGRTQAAAASAPAINSVNAGTTANRNAEGTLGTGRVGGTNANNREASTGAQSNIDNIINTTLQTGKATGAAGLESAAGLTASVGSTELSNALANLGLSQTAISSILSNATESRDQSFKINQQTQQEWGQAASSILGAFGL